MNRLHDLSLRQVDLIRYYDADVSGWQVAVALDAHTAPVTSKDVAEDSSVSAEQVSASTEETSASTQQIAASATEMATSADKLRELVGQFRLTHTD